MGSDDLDLKKPRALSRPRVSRQHALTALALCLSLAGISAPVEQFLGSEHVGVFNKRIVQAALEARNGLVPTWIEGYQTDPAEREIFMPGGGVT